MNKVVVNQKRMKIRLSKIVNYIESLGIKCNDSKSTDSHYFKINNDVNIRVSDHYPREYFDGLGIILSPITDDIIVMIDRRFEVYKSINEVCNFLKSFLLIYNFWDLKRARFAEAVDKCVTSNKLSTDTLPFDISKFSENQKKDIKNKWSVFISSYNGYCKQIA